MADTQRQLSTMEPADTRKEQIKSYWGRRSETFIAQRRAELHDEISRRWLQEITPRLPGNKPLKILDVGCGSGYFSILLAGQGHEVTGVDLTPEMINTANRLMKEEDAVCQFRIMDAEQLDFPDGVFDVVISRNLTWTLPNPETAYREWIRVLKPGGILLNFDANYGLEDSRDFGSLPSGHAHQMLGYDMMDECQRIKEQLPITRCSRPAWDLEVLIRLGMKEFHVDMELSKRVYLKIDEFYNPTPLFLLRAQKRG